MRNTVIVKLQGGLGNQMFQYACGRAVALRRNAELLLDLHLLLDRRPRPNYTMRNYELNVFQVSQQFASMNDIRRVGYGFRERVAARVFKRQARWRRRVYEELPGPAHEQVLNGSGSVYLEGFWQNPRYFAGAEQHIHDEFRLWTPPTGKAANLKQRIANCEAICLHVRRSDFVGSKVTGTCEIDYYRKAVELVDNRVTNATYFVFSDDPSWCRERLTFIRDPIFIDSSDAEDRMEWCQHLMQTCKHFIISNSTFAWWAAYLSQSQNKLVIAPQVWFVDPSLNKWSSEIIPENWIRL